MNKKIIVVGALSLTLLVGALVAQGQAQLKVLEPTSIQSPITEQPIGQTEVQSFATDNADKVKAQQSEVVDKKEVTTATTKSETITPAIKISRSQGTPRVTGSSDFTLSVNQALGKLKDKAPEHYNKVVTYLKEIRESDHSGVIVQTGVFHLGRNTVNGQDTYWLASVIVHDAYHAELYKKGQDYAGKEAEAQCINVQKAALKKMGAADSYQTHLDQVLQSNYWEVPFENRNW